MSQLQGDPRLLHASVNDTLVSSRKQPKGSSLYPTQNNSRQVHEEQVSSNIAPIADASHEDPTLIIINDSSTANITPHPPHPLRRNESAHCHSTTTLFNFTWMSILFSANHGCVVACLALATARLGQDRGAWQSGVLYATYTGSALCLSTVFCHALGARNALMSGMGTYVVYVACFWWLASSSSASSSSSSFEKNLVTLIGAAIGGIGAGFLWTAQGAFFVQASQQHRRELMIGESPSSSSLSSSIGDAVSNDHDVTSKLAGIFAFVYLTEEIALKSLSTLLLHLGFSWSTVFGSYTAIAVMSTLLMVSVRDYDDTNYDRLSSLSPSPSSNQRHGRFPTSGTIDKIMATGKLLWYDPKMKYMAGLNIVFGWTGAFLNSYVNGHVVPEVLGDASSIGLLTAWISVVAAAGSLAFARLPPRTGKVPILMLGALCFMGVALLFLILPDTKKWNWMLLLVVYTLHGTGRATFEGTLKAVFADYFAYEKEGAFANIVLQNGLASAIGYVLTFRLVCQQPSLYCIPFADDGSLHDVLTFELLIVITAILAVFGMWRAWSLYKQQEADGQAFLRSSQEVDVSRQDRPLLVDSGHSA